MNIICQDEQSKYRGMEDPVPSNRLELSSLSSADKVQRAAVITYLDFPEAHDRSKSVVAAGKILRAPESER